jgi:methylmalonyl-CoA/ethylmalonyl-CoA epimerase
VLTRIHHVGIAVVDLDESIGRYRAALGAELVDRQVNEKEGLEAAFLRTGEGEVELMCPTRADSPVGKFLAKRGAGLHHVAYGVTDIREALAAARSAGCELIDAEPRMGMHGSLVAFVHPKSLGGVLTELVET